jgi:hypothetical protein
MMRGVSDTVDVTDLATAQALIATLREELTRTQRENAALRHQLDILCQRLFGKKSERVSPDQLRLAFAQLANEPGPVTDPVEMASARVGRAAVSGGRRADRPCPPRCPGSGSRSTCRRPTSTAPADR